MPDHTAAGKWMVSQSVRTTRELGATTDTAGGGVGDRRAQSSTQETWITRSLSSEGWGWGFMSIRENERQEAQKFKVILNYMANLKPA